MRFFQFNFIKNMLSVFRPFPFKAVGATLYTSDLVSKDTTAQETITMEFLKKGIYRFDNKKLIINGSIEPEVTIEMVDSSLHVKGNIEHDCNISLKTKTQDFPQTSVPLGKGVTFVNDANITVSSGSGIVIGSDANGQTVVIVGGGKISNFNNKCIDLTVEKNIGPRTQITSEGNVKAEDIGENCTINAFYNITTKKIGYGTQLFSSMWGDINTHDLSDKVTVKANAGSIKAFNVGNFVRLTTNAGNIHTRDVGNSVKFSTNSGDIQTGNIGIKCVFESTTGDFDARDIGEETIISMVQGGIKAEHVSPSAFLKTVIGNINVLTAEFKNLSTVKGKVTIGNSYKRPEL